MHRVVKEDKGVFQLPSICNRKVNKNDVKHLVVHFKCSRRENTGAVFEIISNAHRLRYSDNVCENGA